MNKRKHLIPFPSFFSYRTFIGKIFFKQPQRSFLFILFLFCSILSYSQSKSTTPADKLIQFSGVVVSADSLRQIPFVSVMIKGSRHGTITDYNGFFSLVAEENDVIEFSALGFKPTLFTIPDSLPENKYSMIEVLSTDTFLLDEMLVLPWPTHEQFKQAFLKLDLPNDDAARAQRNLDQVRNPEYYGYSGSSQTMNQQLMLLQNNYRVYGTGAIPLSNLMNPLAWSKFISDWRSGKLKKQ